MFRNENDSREEILPGQRDPAGPLPFSSVSRQFMFTGRHERLPELMAAAGDLKLEHANAYMPAGQ